MDKTETPSPLNYESPQPRASARSRSKVLWALLALNIFLGTVLVMRWPGSHAYAQGRRPSDYIMMPANVAGGQANAIVYVVDTSTGQLGAAVYDDNKNNVIPMNSIDLARVFDNNGGRGR